MLTNVEREISNCVSLIKAFKTVKSYCDDVMTVVEETEMNNDQFLAGLTFAFQMSCP